MADLAKRSGGEMTPQMQTFIEATKQVLGNHETRIVKLEDTTEIVVQRLDAVEAGKQYTLGRGQRKLSNGEAFVKGITLGFWDPRG